MGRAKISWSTKVSQCNTNSDYKVAQGATEGGAEACSLQAAQEDRLSKDGIRRKRNWYKAHSPLTL